MPYPMYEARMQAQMQQPDRLVLAVAAGHPLARSALRELLSDEIDHARIGWAFVGPLPTALRDELAPWMLPLATANLGEWRKLTRSVDGSPEPEDSAALERHGFLRRSRIDAVLLAAMRDLIIPGLAMVGLQTPELVAWADGEAR